MCQTEVWSLCVFQIKKKPSIKTRAPKLLTQVSVVNLWGRGGISAKGQMGRVGVGAILCKALPTTLRTMLAITAWLPFSPTFQQEKAILQPVEADSAHQMVNLQTLQKLMLPFRFHSQKTEDTVKQNFKFLCSFLSDQDFYKYFWSGSFYLEGRFNSLHRVQPEESREATKLFHKIQLIRQQCPTVDLGPQIK